MKPTKDNDIFDHSKEGVEETTGVKDLNIEVFTVNGVSDMVFDTLTGVKDRGSEVTEVLYTNFTKKELAVALTGGILTSMSTDPETKAAIELIETIRQTKKAKMN